MTDKRIRQLHGLFTGHGDPAVAVKQQDYLKSRLRFHGLKTALRRELTQMVFPRGRITRAEYEPVIRDLWESGWYDEQAAALGLLKRILKELQPGDVPWLHQLTRGCHTWALLDTLACEILGPLAVTHGDKLYKPVRKWSTDEHMWTRRASILVHIIPGRKARLDDEYAWPTFEERLHETEFFIRKAIGWTLRDLSKHYPQQVYEFLTRVGDRASGLTRREGARNLPDELRISILGK